MVDKVKTDIRISTGDCHLLGNDCAENIIIIPMMPRAEDENAALLREIISASGNDSILMAAVDVADWNSLLSPWEYRDENGKKSFSGNGSKLLSAITDELVPAVFDVVKKDRNDTCLALGGYSLAGLFSLWSGYNTDIFKAVVSCSGSVWFPDFEQYCMEKIICCDEVYMSLGKKEEKARDPLMKKVGDASRSIFASLEHSGLSRCFFEWNEGGHFNDIDGRLAKGFAFILKK